MHLEILYLSNMYSHFCTYQDADSELTPTKFLLPMDAKTPNSIKKLFSEPEISGTQEKLDELAGLFAGKFNGNVFLYHKLTINISVSICLPRVEHGIHLLQFIMSQIPKMEY